MSSLCSRSKTAKTAAVESALEGAEVATAKSADESARMREVSHAIKMLAHKIQTTKKLLLLQVQVQVVVLLLNKKLRMLPVTRCCK